MQRTITLTNGRIKWILLYTLWAIYAFRCAFRCANHEEIAQKYAVDYFSICAFFLMVVVPVLSAGAYFILKKWGVLKDKFASNETECILMTTIHRRIMVAYSVLVAVGIIILNLIHEKVIDTSWVQTHSMLIVTGVIYGIAFMLPHLTIIYRHCKVRDCLLSCTVAGFMLIQMVALMFNYYDFVDLTLFGLAFLHTHMMNLWYCIRDTKIIRKLFVSLQALQRKNPCRNER